MTERRPALPASRSTALPNKLRDEGRSRARTRSPTPQIAAYYNKNKARFAQPETRDLRDRPDQDRGEGRRSAKAALESGAVVRSRSPRSTRSTRPPRRSGGVLLGRRQGPAGEGPRRRDLRRQEGQARRPGQDAVRLLRLRGHEDHAGHAADARRRRRPTIKQTARVAEPAERARRRSSRTSSKKWKDEDGLPRRATSTPDCKNAPKADDDDRRPPAPTTPARAPRRHRARRRRRRTGRAPRTAPRRDAAGASRASTS